MDLAQIRRVGSEPLPATSGLPRTTDIITPTGLVRFVPQPGHQDISLIAGLPQTRLCNSRCAQVRVGSFATVDVARKGHPLRSPNNSLRLAAERFPQKQSVGGYKLTFSDRSFSVMPCPRRAPDSQRFSTTWVASSIGTASVTR